MMDVVVFNIDSINENFARQWEVKSLNQLQDSGFSASRCTDEGHFVALADFQVKVIENMSISSLILEAQSFNLDTTLNWCFEHL